MASTTSRPDRSHGLSSSRLGIDRPDLPKQPPYTLERGQPTPRWPSLLRPSIAIIRSAGILTRCPSSTAFAIPLGPTNPWLIDITKETLIFRRGVFSTPLRLLVPTFLLPHAPVWLTPSPSTQSGKLSYQWTHPKACPVLSFGTILNPDYLRRAFSR